MLHSDFHMKFLNHLKLWVCYPSYHLYNQPNKGYWDGLALNIAGDGSYIDLGGSSAHISGNINDSGGVSYFKISSANNGGIQFQSRSFDYASKKQNNTTPTSI